MELVIGLFINKPTYSWQDAYADWSTCGRDNLWTGHFAD